MSERQKAEAGLKRLLHEKRESGFFTHAYVECGSLVEKAPAFSHFEGAAQTKIFDLASLTKALVTTPLVFSFLVEVGLDLNAPLKEWFGKGGKTSSLPESLLQLTAAELLAHQSGLPAWRCLWVNRLGPESPLSELRQSALPFLSEFFGREAWQLRQKADCYSDVGFILLGYCLEALKEKSISELFTLFLKKTNISSDDSALFLGFFDASLHRAHAIPTGYCAVRGRSLQGEVYDENCAALGGAFSHAGLFSSGPGLSNYLKKLRGSTIGARVFEENARKISRKKDSSLVGLRQGNDDSANTFGQGLTMGHLGFTGTAFWIEPKTESYAMVLTNRVISGRVNPEIKSFRRDAFDHLNQLL